ncbi:sodium:proton antiporter [Inquilinus sp. Marseille-Q2685]|uniref:cation:proton antiporter n=1 Tax=Inquilinus sp. Marseille-Q2685 TaxID=2866581 RepID=UPI001CE4A870|nr:cation:proton antiporter [Inquilinus sp. Marseille-Q2685]
MPETFDASAVVILVLGALVLLSAWLPLVVRRLPLSLPIVAVGIGVVAPHGPWIDRASAFLLQERVLEQAVEFIILVALMGAGLRVERPFGWRRWQATWRLLGIAMPLTIATMAALCWAALGLPWAAALLVAAALAPTDPVLACDVQAGPPGEEEGGEVRFALTSEAGLNDGLAFPFVVLAMTLAATPLESAWVHWLAGDVIWRIGCGALIGYAAGRVFGWLTFRLPRLKLSRTGDGLVAVGVTLISFGVTELAAGYGFVAVFIAAVTLRATDRSSDFHGAMAEFSEQIERVLMVVVLLVFGAAVGTGALARLEWRDVLVGAALLLVIRPLCGWVSLIGTKLPRAARGLMAFFGIRGLGTFYYMAYALGRAEFPDAGRLWAITSFAVLGSIVMHGIASTPLMAWADRRRRAAARPTRSGHSERRRA